MFASTRPLMFRSISPLQGFKLHQQLPMTPRESQQLLNVLTTSFREQLDRQHGVLRDEDGGSKMQKEGSRTAKSIEKRRNSMGQHDLGSHQPTDRHLYSILTNPLFGHDIKKKSETQKLPMEIFDDGVARGIMTLASATACLRGERNVILRSASPSVRDGMKESGAGLRVLNWLESSDFVNNASFLQDEAFTKIFFEFLVAEGLESEVWSWLVPKFMAIPGLSDKKNIKLYIRRNLAYPIFSLATAETAHNVALDAGYKCVHRAATYMNALDVSLSDQRRALEPSARYLIFLSTNPDSRSRRPTPGIEAFSQFLATIENHTPRADWSQACLHVYSPINPTAMPVLRFVQSPLHQPFEPHNPTLQIQCLLDASKLLLEEGRFNEARWLMRFMEETFPQQLGIPRTKQHVKGTDRRDQKEASSLQLLQSLSLG